MYGQHVDLISVYSTNFVGVLLMLTLLLTRGWRVQARKKESRILLVMVVSALAGCVLDPIIFTANGQPGNINSTIIYFGNAIMLSINTIIGPGFVTLIARHINERLTKLQKTVIIATIILELSLILINFFTPIVFVVNENNLCVWLEFHWIYLAIEVFLVIYGLAVYISARVSGQTLRFFPAWEFLIPMATGIVFQGLVYNVSIVWPCVGVALCGVAICIKDESIYVDKLTGVYNRYCLDEVCIQIQRRRYSRVAAMMLDLNGFKSINDGFSHAEGDYALVAFAKLLTSVVKDKGIVVRFAGDEFVIIIYSANAAAVESYRSQIQAALETYNNDSGKPYALSAAIGGDSFDFKTDADSFLQRIDKLMYEDKREYYRIHDRRAATALPLGAEGENI